MIFNDGMPKNKTMSMFFSCWIYPQARNYLAFRTEDESISKRLSAESTVEALK